MLLEADSENLVQNGSAHRNTNWSLRSLRPRELEADLIIAGGGMGGCAAALSAAERGLRVILTEETDWIGGQLTSQAVPPDEHPWIEQFGCTRRYRRFRESVRDYYRANFPLSRKASRDPLLNPGGGRVSRLCHEPRVAHAVLEQQLAFWRSCGRILLLLEHRPVAVHTTGDRINAVTFLDLQEGSEVTLSGSWFIDATELGDLLPLGKVEYVSGAEARRETGEPHAKEEAQPDNVQGVTWCFAMAHDPDCPNDSDRYRISKPENYDFWRNYQPNLNPGWCGKMYDWAYCHPVTLKPIERVLFRHEAEIPGRAIWDYRQIFSRNILDGNHPGHDVSLVNWPQNDYFEGNLIDQPRELFERYCREAKEMSLGFFYWLQTEAPRPDGGQGYGSLYLKPDILGTPDGFAKAPYIRESRRIRALFTVTENHIGVEAREGRFPDPFPDSVGVGSYRIDLHPSTGGDNYIDIAAFPFQVPLGSLIPQRVENLIAGCKNIGVTHITNGCYRLHPVEWNVGEVAGLLAAYCVENRSSPKAVYQHHLKPFQDFIVSEGVELKWPDVTAR